MNDDKTEAKGFATEHLPKLIAINDTTVAFVPMIRDPGDYIGLFHLINKL